jgi:hypothetical protein
MLGLIILTIIAAIPVIYFIGSGIITFVYLLSMFNDEPTENELS